MPENFLHGVSVVEVDSGPRSIRGTSSSVIGIVGACSTGVYSC
jgi:phage tail sheath protein FI